MYNKFLRYLHKDNPTVTPTPSKLVVVVQGMHSNPEILLQNIGGFMNAPKQIKLEAPKVWIPSHSSLQPYTKSLYKFVTYYIVDHNYNIVQILL